MNFLRFLPLIMKGKSIADAYRDETGQDKPFYMSRRFIGAAIAFIGAALGIASGIQLDANVLDSITGNVEVLISAGIALYGGILAIVGVVKKQPQ